MTKRKRKALPSKKRPTAPTPPACACIAYESSEEDDAIGMGACHCGHAPEEHTFAGCEWEPSK